MLLLDPVCFLFLFLPKQMKESIGGHPDQWRNDDRQAGFVVTIYDEDGLRLAATPPLPTPDAAFGEARKMVDNKVEGPRK